MGVFFETKRDPEHLERVLRDTLQQTPPPADKLNAIVKGKLDAATAPTSVQPRLSSFAVAAGLLVLFAGFALWAESHTMPKATDNLWTAFQTVLAIVIGFISGEATGAAATKAPAGDGS